MAEENKAVAEKTDKPVKKETSTKKKPNIFVRFFRRIGKFFKEARSEIRKVTWPTPKQVARDTLTVIVIVVISALFIGVIDFVFKSLIGMFNSAMLPF